jgi:hypothetical protein
MKQFCFLHNWDDKCATTSSFLLVDMWSGDFFCLGWPQTVNASDLRHIAGIAGMYHATWLETFLKLEKKHEQYVFLRTSLWSNILPPR